MQPMDVITGIKSNIADRLFEFFQLFWCGRFFFAAKDKAQVAAIPLVDDGNHRFAGDIPANDQVAGLVLKCR